MYFSEFIGKFPQLMVTDPVMLRDILVKESNNFIDRGSEGGVSIAC